MNAFRTLLCSAIVTLTASAVAQNAPSTHSRLDSLRPKQILRPVPAQVPAATRHAKDLFAEGPWHGYLLYGFQTYVILSQMMPADFVRQWLTHETRMTGLSADTRSGARRALESALRGQRDIAALGGAMRAASIATYQKNAMADAHFMVGMWLAQAMTTAMHHAASSDLQQTGPDIANWFEHASNATAKEREFGAGIRAVISLLRANATFEAMKPTVFRMLRENVAS